ncbi:hypothetical protein BGX38DRAFT_781806 [Terfezia claveryi]|nr:hypothetical protein BGX38DRAFT_781806 [Terfezia claveryi]
MHQMHWVGMRIIHLLVVFRLCVCITPDCSQLAQITFLLLPTPPRLHVATTPRSGLHSTSAPDFPSPSARLIFFSRLTYLVPGIYITTVFSRYKAHIPDIQATYCWLPRILQPTAANSFVPLGISLSEEYHNEHWSELDVCGGWGRFIDMEKIKIKITGLGIFARWTYMYILST